MSEKQKTIENVLKKKIIESICNSGSKVNIKSNIEKLYIPIVVFLEREFPTFIKATIIQSQFLDGRMDYDKELYGILMRLCGYGLLERSVVENNLYVRIRAEIKELCNKELDNRYQEEKMLRDTIKKKPQEI